MVNLSKPFDFINKWIEPSSNNERHLWIFDRKTQEVNWKSRKVYSFWQFRESGRLQEIFDNMVKLLPSELVAIDKNQFASLIKLKGRVVASYDGYMKAHGTFFGFFYKLFFGYFLSNNYQNLIKKLDGSLIKSFKNCDLTSLTPKEIESLANSVKNKSDAQFLKIDWERLTLDQFIAAYPLKEFFATSSILDALDKEKTTYLLDKVGINKFSNHDIEQNIQKIEPRFLHDIKYHSKMDLSKFSFEHIIEILKFGDNDIIYLSSFDLTTIDPKHCICDKFDEFLKKNSSLLKKLPPEVIAANFNQIDPRDYSKLSADQLKKVDFSSYTGDQFLKIIKVLPTIDKKKLEQLDLNLFSAENIKEMKKLNLIIWLSAKTVAANFDKFEFDALPKFGGMQKAALNISQLSVDQIIQLCKESYGGVNSGYLTDEQWLSLDLANYTEESIEKLLSTFHAGFINVLHKLAPATVAANLSKIAIKHYNHLTDKQIKEIDYLSLNENQKKYFNHPPTLNKMKNGPKIDPNDQNDFDDIWGNLFGKKFGKKFNSNFFSGFGFDNAWSNDFFNGFENPGAKKANNKKTDNAQFSESDPKLKSFHSNLATSVEKIKITDKVHPNEAYEKLRQKCLNKEKELKKHPELIFVDDLKVFDINNLKKQYQKLALVIHPDKNGDRVEEATELFKLISEAFKYLTT